MINLDKFRTFPAFIFSEILAHGALKGVRHLGMNRTKVYLQFCKLNSDLLCSKNVSAVSLAAGVINVRNRIS